jgi:hypothetical protein
LAVRLEKPWHPLNRDGVRSLPGQLGVFQISDADGEIVLIGFAGGRSLFGLRGELEQQAEQRGEAGFQYRIEVTTQYHTRYRELLMVFVADHGRLPRDNKEDIGRLGKLHPA